MITSEKIRVIIIGAGKMGLAHAVAFSKISNAEIVGIASRSIESAEQLAGKFGVRFFGTDWKGVVKKSNPVAAVICVPHLLTEQVTQDVIECGLHVLVEKPISLHSKSVKNLALRAKEMGVVAMVAMNRRFYSTIQDGILTAKFFGKVLGVTVIAPDPVKSYRAESKYSPVVYDQWFMMNTIHIVDLMRLVGGDVDTVSSIKTTDGGEISRAALIKYLSGTIGTFTSINSVGGMNHWELIIHGEGVEVRLKPLERGLIIHHNGVMKPIEIKTKQGDKHGVLDQAISFITSVTLGKVAYPGSDLDDHAKTMELAKML